MLGFVCFIPLFDDVVDLPTLTCLARPGRTASELGHCPRLARARVRHAALFTHLKIGLPACNSDVAAGVRRLDDDERHCHALSFGPQD
jgi:hypothetical protein